MGRERLTWNNDKSSIRIKAKKWNWRRATHARDKMRVNSWLRKWKIEWNSDAYGICQNWKRATRMGHWGYKHKHEKSKTHQFIPTENRIYNRNEIHFDTISDLFFSSITLILGWTWFPHTVFIEWQTTSSDGSANLTVSSNWTSNGFITNW